MQTSKFELILTEPNGNYAIPDINITTDMQTVFNIQNASDISQRKDTLTQSITFPGTKNNNRIFNNLYSLNRDADGTLEENLYFNYSPVVGVRAVLFENNYPLVSGLLTIQDIAKDKNTGMYTYTGIITGNLVNFFGKLKDVLLTDMQLFNQSVTIDWETISGSWSYDPTKPYLFPAIDYGKGISPDPTRFDIRNYRPAFYARHYVKQMLGKYGYRYKSTFIDSDLFNRAFIPYNALDFGSVVTGDVVVFNGITRPQINMNRNDSSTVLTGLFYNDFIANQYVTYHEENAHGVNGGWGRSNVKNDRPIGYFQFNKASNTGATIDYHFQIFSHAKSTQVYVQIFKLYSSTVNIPFIGNITYPNTFDADSPVAQANIGYGSEAKLVWTDIHGTLQLPVDNYDKDQKFALIITTVTDKGDDLELQQLSTKITFGNPDVTVGSVFSYDDGDTVDLSTTVPATIKAVDLLKTLFTFFNLYAIENPDDDQELIIEPYDLFYSKTRNPARYAADWTKKIDNSSLHIKINTALPSAYNFKFTEDSDFYNTLYKKTYGANYGDFSIDNSVGTADAKDITGIFAATPIVTENKDTRTMPAIFGGTLLAKEAIESKPRILFNNGIGTCGTYNVVLTKGESGALSYDARYNNIGLYQLSHHVLNIDSAGATFNALFALPKAVYYTVDASVFTTPLLFTLYQGQLIELDDINIFQLEVDAHLRDFDIAALDLTRPIFINTVQGIAYFKIMSVTYFNSDVVSNLVLQKIVPVPSMFAEVTGGSGGDGNAANFVASASYNYKFTDIRGAGIPDDYKNVVIDRNKSEYLPKMTAGVINVQVSTTGSPDGVYLQLVKDNFDILAEVQLHGAGSYTINCPIDILAPTNIGLEINMH